MQEQLKVSFQRTVQVDQYEPRTLLAEVAYQAGADEASTIANAKAAFKTAAESVLSAMGIAYEVKDGVVVENPEATVQAKIIQAFPNTVETAAPTPIRSAPADSGVIAEATEYLRGYTGDFNFLVDVKAKTVSMGKPLSEKQAASVLKCKAKDKAFA